MTQLIDVIQGLKSKKFAGSEKKAAENALDALVQVNLTSASKSADFTVALSDNKAFWDSQGGFAPLTEEHDYAKTQQQAAEQRVLLGLQTAADDILVAILKNNADECRKYIQSRPELGTFIDSAGQPAKPDEVLKPAITLTDAALKEIREQAGLLLLNSLVKHAHDRQALNACSAAKDKDKLHAAVMQLSNSRGLKFPTEGFSALPAAIERYNELQQNALKRIEYKEVQLAQLNKGLQQTALDSQKITALAQATKLGDFTKILAEGLGYTNVDWIDSKDMLTLQQSARNKIFVMRLNQISSLQAAAHPHLLAALAFLPVNRQNELLNNNKVRALRALMDIDDSAQLQRFFNPKTAEEQSIINALLNENKRLSVFKQLHNAVLAEVLANIQPPVALTGEQIKQINKTLLTSIDDLLTHSVALFGQDSAKVQAAITAKKTEIEQQRASQQSLYKHYSPTELDGLMQQPLVKEILKLRINVSFEPQAVKELNKLLLQCSSVDDFIKAVNKNAQIVADTDGQGNLIKALSLELNQAHYAEMHRIAMLHDPKLKEQAIAEITNALNTSKKQQKSVFSALSALDSLIENKLFNGDNGSLRFGPAFADAVRKRPVAIKTEFDALAQKTTAVINRLTKHKEHIDNYLNSLPANSSPVDKQVEQLRKNLIEELEVLSEKIERYQQARTQINKIVVEVSRVLDNTNMYVYQGNNISHTACSAAELNQLKKSKTMPSQDPLGATNSVKNKVALHVLEGKQYCMYAVTHKNEQDVMTKGSFAQSYALPDKVYVNASNQATKIPLCKVELIQPLAVAAQNSAGAKLTPADQANFYLSMAIALIIANGGKAPTKEQPVRLSGGTNDEMQHLWTAFVIIGEQSTLKFGLDEIKVESGCFDPSKVVSKGIFSTQFEAHSFYKKLKGSDGKFIPTVASKIEEFNTIMADAGKTRKALADATSNTTSFKELFKEQKSGKHTAALDVLNAVTNSLPKDASAVLDAGMALKK